MQAIFQPYFLKNINVECTFKMLLSPNGDQMFSEAHESQEKIFCRSQAALDCFPRPVWSHPPRCCTVLILFTWAELHFHVTQEENVWEESGHSLKSTSLCCQTGRVTGIKHLANDHRTAKITLDVCTPLEKLTQTPSEAAQTQRMKSGMYMWTAPQPQEPHLTCASMAFKSQTLILLYVRDHCPHGLTQSHPVVELQRNSALKLRCTAIIQWLPPFFLFTRPWKSQ